MAHVPTEVRRQQFIDAAVTVIAREGVDGATTRRIADEAAAPLATLHYCFQTKENLLWAVFQQLSDTGRQQIAEVPEGQTPAVMAARLLDATIRWAIESPEVNRAQIEIWLWAERNDSEFANRLYALFLDSCETYLRGAKPALTEDQLQSVTRVIVALVDGLCMQLITHGDEKLVLRGAETAAAMLQAYLGGRTRRTATAMS